MEKLPAHIEVDCDRITITYYGHVVRMEVGEDSLVLRLHLGLDDEPEPSPTEPSKMLKFRR